LAKSPADRFQSAAEVASLLEQWLAHLAQPMVNLPPRVVPAKKPRTAAGRRINPWLAGIAAASLVLAIGAAGLGIGQWLENRTPREATSADLRQDISPSPSPPQPVSEAFSERAFHVELEEIAERTAAIEFFIPTQPDDARLPADELAELNHQLSLLEAELAPRLPAAPSIFPDHSTSLQGD
jgi:hypothetical protein